MSNRRGAFPTKLEDLNEYFSSVVAYLTANATRLQITTANVNALNLLYSNPGADTNDLGWAQLWLLHTNPVTATVLITALLQKRLRQQNLTDPMGLENLLRVIYDDIPKSALTVADRSTLHLKQRKATRSTHHTATQNTVTWSSGGIGGGSILTKCYPSGPASNNPTAKSAITTRRAHKEAGYEIRTACLILKPGEALPTIPENGTVLDIPGIKAVVDTKAHLVWQVGTANAGNMLVEYKQWHNPKHPNLDSPWSGPKTCIIT